MDAMDRARDAVELAGEAVREATPAAPRASAVELAHATMGGAPGYCAAALLYSLSRHAGAPPTVGQVHALMTALDATRDELAKLAGVEGGAR